MAEQVKGADASEFPFRVASPEFFFLLERIDRLDEKLSGKIEAVEARLSAKIEEGERKSGGLFKWSVGLVIANLALTLATLGLVISLMVRLAH